MRTTITLKDDVAAAVERLRRERGVGISDVVNELLRRGLSGRSERPRFVQVQTSMGRPSVALDDVAGLLDVLEGDGRHE